MNRRNLDKHIWDLSYLKLSTRAKNCLLIPGLYTLRILKKTNPSFKELLKINNCGKKTASEIVAFIKTL